MERTCKLICPSFQQQHVAAKTSVRQFLVRDAHAPIRYPHRRERRVRVNSAPSAQLHLPALKRFERIFSPACRSPSRPTYRPARRAARAHQLDPAAMVGDAPCEKFRRTTSHAARRSRTAAAGSCRGGTQGRDILCAEAGIHAARSRRISRRGVFCLDKLQECAAARRYVGNTIPRSRISRWPRACRPAGQRKMPASRNRLGEGAGPFAELLELEHAPPAIPEIVPADAMSALIASAESARYRGSSRHPHRRRRLHIGLSLRGELSGDHHVGGASVSR